MSDECTCCDTVHYSSYSIDSIIELAHAHAVAISGLKMLCTDINQYDPHESSDGSGLIGLTSTANDTAVHFHSLRTAAEAKI